MLPTDAAYAVISPQDTKMESVPYYSISLISSYNLNVCPFLEFNCDECYADYRTLDQNRLLIESRQSYMACLKIDESCLNGCADADVKRAKSEKKKIRHKQVPIMLGSKIDMHIRGEALVKDTIRLWGTFILEGTAKLYYSYSTFDSLSMHVRNKEKSLFIQWYFYVNQTDGVGLTYRQGVVEWTFKRHTYSSSSQSQSPEESWLELIKKHMQDTFLTNLLNREHLRKINSISENDYITFWNKLIRSPYNMNDLQHRQIISCPHIMKKYILYCINRNKLVYMKEGFEKSRFYSILNKNNAYENKAQNKKQSYGITAHEGRSDKIHHFLPTVARAASDAICNSNIIEYPKDGKPFYCLLNAKDLKVAGVQNILTDYTLVSEETNPSFVYTYLVQNYGHWASERDDPNFKHLILNGCLISCGTIWTLDKLKALKTQFPFISSKYVAEYAIVSTKNCILLKYSEVHGCLFSPGEIQYFGIEFYETDYISITPKCFDFKTLIMTPPAKTTVAINNTRGGCSQYSTELQRIIAQGTLGTTCFSKITPEHKERIFRSCVLEECTADLAAREHFDLTYAKLKAKFSLLLSDAHEDDKLFKRTSHPKALASLYYMYKKNVALTVSKNQNACMRKETYIKYLNMIYGLDINWERQQEFSLYDGSDVEVDQNIYSKDLRLYVAFGNINGACNADGVVIDEKVVKLVPKLDYSSCITVDFIFKSNKAVSDTKIILNEVDPFDSIVCLIVTEHEIKPVNSKHCRLYELKIGKQRLHMVKFMLHVGKEHNYRIRYEKKNYSIKLIITFLQEHRLHVGNKINNEWGQKNIFAAIADLEPYWGVTRDGRKVHAQLLYDPVSIFTKEAAGQIAYMLSSKDLAIGKDIFLAPIDITIHTLTPVTNLKLAPLKVDTYSNTMGFDCQLLSSCRLRRNNGKSLLEDVRTFYSLHGAQLFFDNFKVLHKVDCSPSDEPRKRAATVKQRNTFKRSRVSTE